MPFSHLAQHTSGNRKLIKWIITLTEKKWSAGKKKKRCIGSVEAYIVESKQRKKKNPKKKQRDFSVVFSNLLTAMEMPPAPEGFRWKQNGKWNEVKR